MIFFLLCFGGRAVIFTLRNYGLCIFFSAQIYIQVHLNAEVILLLLMGDSGR